MDPRKLFLDERLKETGSCVYCGAKANSRDHVPSKVLLDDPLPSNLPVVEACSDCNGGFSLDEQYLACFLECVLVGASNPDLLQRPKIKHILNDKIHLRNRIQSCCRTDDKGGLIWFPEIERVRNVVIKLARGHAAYELSIPQFEPPNEVSVTPLISMSDADRSAFENAGAYSPEDGTLQISLWPELGSRAFRRACGASPYSNQRGPWVIIQPNRYRYTVDQYGGVKVRIAIAEYLACVVDWDS